MKENSFKILANRYVEESGRQLDWESEQEAVMKLSLPPKRKRRKRVREIFFAAATAAILVSVFIGRFFLINQRAPSDAVAPVHTGNLKPILAVSGNRFQLSETVEDNGDFIYHIKAHMQDDVVVTIEKGTKYPDDMRLCVVAGNEVYYKMEDGYNIILYSRNKHTITMSCQYDFQTLVELCEDARIIF